MTDAEIIKALECCTTKGTKCSDCPAFKKVDRSDCKKYFRGAIDLINRQQAEIEKLERTISYLEGVCESTPDKVRAEAIKEFAYRLKQKSEYYENGQGWEGRICYDDDIDKLLKEMVGEE